MGGRSKQEKQHSGASRSSGPGIVHMGTSLCHLPRTREESTSYKLPMELPAHCAKGRQGLQDVKDMAARVRDGTGQVPAWQA